MRFEIRFHRLAFRELQSAARHYRSESARTADRFIAALDRALQKVGENPLQWPEFDDGYRWYRVRKFPYVLYFEIKSEDRIRIMAVAHNQRRPGYWIKRANRP